LAHGGNAFGKNALLQDQKIDVKILTNSEKVGYKKRPRPVYGPGFEAGIDSLANEPSSA
jgi:hypothetical protein